MEKELRQEDIKPFVLGGNATVTLQSGNTGNYFTYKIIRCKNDERLYFVKLLIASDNEDDKSYRYIGAYYMDSGHFHITSDQYNKPELYRAPSVRAITYFFKHINKIPENLHVYHEGYCGVCGKKLTTPESIERGIGPLCYKRTMQNKEEE